MHKPNLGRYEVLNKGPGVGIDIIWESGCGDIIWECWWS